MGHLYARRITEVYVASVNKNYEVLSDTEKAAFLEFMERLERIALTRQNQAVSLRQGSLDTPVQQPANRPAAL